MADLANAAAAAGALCAAGSLCCACAAASLLPKRSSARAFPALLEYAALQDRGAVLLKSGALMSCFECFPPDLEDLAPSAREALRKRLSALLLHCDGRTVIACDMVRDRQSPAQLPYEGPAGAAALERARAIHLGGMEFFKNRFFISFIRKSPLRAKALAARSLDPQSTDFKRDIDAFLKERAAFQDSLSLCFECKALGEAPGSEGELLSFLSRCVLLRNRPVAVPSERFPLDALLSCEDFTPGLAPIVGPVRLSCVCLDAYPSETAHCALSSLLELPFPLRISERCIGYDPMASGIMMSRRRRLFEQKRRGLLSQIFNVQGGRADSDATKQAEDVGAAQDSLNSREEAFGALSFAAIIGAGSLEALRERTRLAVRAIEECGFGARVETVNATECYLGSLPGNFRANVRRPLVSNSVLADLLPFCGTNAGEAQSPNRGYEGRAPLMQLRAPRGGLFCLNLHSGDLGNTVVAGPPGTGKSVLLNALIHGFLRYKGMRVWAFERGYSLYALCRTAGGTHCVLDGGAGLCPLEELSTPEDLGRARDYLMELCAIPRGAQGASDEKAICDALSLLASRPSGSRTLSDFSMLCSSRQVRLSLEPWLKGGGRSGILDGERDPKLDGALCVFECAGLFSRRRECAMVLRHLLGRIRRICESGPEPCAIVLDEAWIMLQDGTFREDLASWLKSLRKHNTAVVMATQSLSDLDGAGELLDCAKTRILLPNPDAASASMAPLYEKAGLSQHEIAAVASGVPRRDVFLKKDSRFSRLNLALSKEELSIYSLAGTAALKAFEGKDGEAA